MTIRRLTASLIAVMLAGSMVARADAQPTTQRMSSSGSAQSDRASGYAAITLDGRYVAFQSYATNIVPGDTNNGSDVFVSDRRSGAIRRISVASDGAEARYDEMPAGVQGWGSTEPSISDNGNRIAFSSEALNLAGVAPGSINVFVRDLVTNTTRLLSYPAPGKASVACESTSPTISGNGRYVAFMSGCDNLVSSDVNGQPDVFVRDLDTGAIERISVSSAETPANGANFWPAISADGNYVAFMSNASNLWPNDNNGKYDVFRRDRASGITMIISYTVSQRMHAGSLQPHRVAISADGSRVAFATDGGDLLPGDTNAAVDVFVRDMSVGTIERASVSATGAQLPLGGTQPSMSDDGRVVAFESLSTDAVSNDTNGVADVFARHLGSDTTTRVSLGASGGQGNGASNGPSLNADGTVVGFESSATDFVANDSNLASDVFVRGLPLPPLPARPTITSPVAGSVLRTATVTVRGAAGPGTTIRVLDGSTPVGTSPAAADGTWSVAATLAEGAHVLTAVASDTDDSEPSAPVHVTVDLSAVVPAIISPPQGAALRSSTITVAGTAAPSAAVALEADGLSAAASTADANGSWTAQVALGEGAHSLTATATDPQGRVTTTPTARTFTVDLTAPSIPTIASPAQDATITTPGSTATGQGEAGSRVILYEGSAAFASTTVASAGVWSVALPLGNGTHTIKAVAADVAGNTSLPSASRTFTIAVDRVAPTVAITTPTNSAFSPDAVLISGTASDQGGAVASVFLTYVNVVTGTRVITDRPAQCACGAEATWSDAPAIEPGYYRVTAVATDTLGNRSRTVSISFLTL